MNTKKKYYIIAGEASGDTIAANLIKAMKALDDNIEFRGWGGDKMKSENVNVVKHFVDLAYVGFWEVFIHIFTICKNFAFCKKDILNYQPDCMIFVDYPGFNLRMTKFANKHNIRTVYYVSPQIWAWKKNRIKKIIKHVDNLLTILPFETEYYAKYNYSVNYVGHPIVEEIEKFKNGSHNKISDDKLINPENKEIIALIPGSRKQEVKYLLSEMVKISKKFPEYQFVISKVSWLPESLYRSITSDLPLVEDDMYSLLQSSKAAIVTSGTASLETALMNIPQMVVYKGSELSYRIALLLVKGIKYISLVNLILDKQVFSEFIQHDVNEDCLSLELSAITNNYNRRKQMLAYYSQLRKILADGTASKKAAEIILRQQV